MNFFINIKAKIINIYNEYIRKPFLNFLEYRFREITREDVSFFSKGYVRYYSQEISYLFENDMFSRTSIDECLVGVYFKDILINSEDFGQINLRVSIALTKLPMTQEMYLEMPDQRKRYLAELHFLFDQNLFGTQISNVVSTLSNLSELECRFISDENLQINISSVLMSLNAVKKAKQK